jgi:hypothetical protein
MLNESLVRAAQPRYYLAHGDTASAERAIGEEIRLGFTWTRELVALLAQYERNRVALSNLHRVHAASRDVLPRWRP